MKDFEPTLSPKFIAYVRDTLLDNGIDPAPLFERAGLEFDEVQEFDSPVPVEQVAALFEGAVQETGSTTVGMDMGLQYHYQNSSLLILAMLAAPSVEEGLKCLHNYDKYIDTAIATSFNFDQPKAEFSARILAPAHVKVDQLNEYLMAFLVQALGMATRKPIPLHEVRFRHCNNRNERILESAFSAPILFSQEDNRLVFDRGYLKQRFFCSNSLLHEILVNAMKTYFITAGSSGDFVDAVCREITLMGSFELPTTELIARRLALSPRSLRRRLADEGYSFQEVKNLSRQKRAKYYLSQTRMSLSEIAFELGYSELSAFSRAYRAWTGQTPQTYRDNYKKLL